MHPAVLEQKARMVTEASARDPQQVRHLWIYLSVRQCAALSRGHVSTALRRQFDELLNGWKTHRRRPPS